MSCNEPINAIDVILHQPFIDLEYHRFKTPGLCDIAMVDESVDTIVLNTNQSGLEQNFDCAHELVRLFKHRNIQTYFKCFTKVKPRQNTFIEWQANEGAAQFLVPYQDFIPPFHSVKDINVHFSSVSLFCRRNGSKSQLPAPEDRSGA